MPQDKTILGDVIPEPIRQQQILQCGICVYVWQRITPALTIVGGHAVCSEHMPLIISTNWPTVLRTARTDREARLRYDHEMKVHKELEAVLERVMADEGTPGENWEEAKQKEGIWKRKNKT